MHPMQERKKKNDLPSGLRLVPHLKPQIDFLGFLVGLRTATEIIWNVIQRFLIHLEALASSLHVIRA